MVNSKVLNNVQNNLFNFIIIITWILYLLITFGLSVNAPQYLEDIHYFVKIYISLFLIIRFNPLRRVKFTNLDRKIAFNAGIFLLGTSFINQILQNYFSHIKQLVNLSKFNSN
jgi:hypothetical protein